MKNGREREQKSWSKKGRVLQELWHSAKVKLWCVLLFKTGFFIFFSLNPSLSQESEGTKDSCIPLILQWENSEQKSLQQQKFSLLLPDLNLCHSVTSVLLPRAYCCDCTSGPLLVTSRSLICWVSGFLMSLCLLQFTSSSCSRPGY